MSLAVRESGCTYPAARPSGTCGHRSVKAYIGRGGLELRCTAHDSPRAQAEAQRLGYVETKALRVEAVERVEGLR